MPSWPVRGGSSVLSSNAADGVRRVARYDGLQPFRLRDPMAAIGTAALFMSQAEPFATFPMGPWLDTFKGMVLRKHYFFTQQLGHGQVVGFCGWALTSHAAARDWIENRRVLSFEDCLDGPCVLVMAFRALARTVNDFQVAVWRAQIADRTVAYWRRQVPTGGTRTVTINLQTPGVRRASGRYTIEEIGQGA